MTVLVDRIPTKPNRKLITPENGSIQPFYATVTMADEPIEEGVPYNKINIFDTVNLLINNYNNSLGIMLDDYYTTEVYQLSGTDYLTTYSHNFGASGKIGGRALFAGGERAGNTMHGTVSVYGEDYTKYTNSYLSFSAYHLAGISTPSHAIFAGGWNSNSADVSDVNAFNSSLVRTSLSSLSIARMSLGASYVNGFTLFAGGKPYSGSATTTVDVYDSNLVKQTNITLTNAKDVCEGSKLSNYALFATSTSSNMAVDAFNASLVKTNISSSLAVSFYPVAVNVEDYAIFLNYGTYRAYNNSLTVTSSSFGIGYDYPCRASSPEKAVLFGGYIASSGNKNSFAIYNDLTVTQLANLGLACGHGSGEFLNDVALIPSGYYYNSYGTYVMIFDFKGTATITVPPYYEYKFQMHSSPQFTDEQLILVYNGQHITGYMKPANITLSGLN